MGSETVGEIHEERIIRRIRELVNDPRHDNCGCSLGMEILAVLSEEQGA